VIELTVDQSKLVALSRLMKAESNKATLRAELVSAFKTIVEPGVAQVREKLNSLPNKGTPDKPALGSYLASRAKVSVRLSGRSAGVYVRIGFTPNIRGFKLAARRLNRTKWRHPVYGNRAIWVDQISPIPGYFEGTLMKYKEEYRAAVIAACNRLALRLGERL
jgi:hypothetical protein